MKEKMWSIARAVLLDKRLVSVGCLLLVLVLIDDRLPCGIHPAISELDTLEHFVFGFFLSDFASNIANSTGLHETLNDKYGQGKSRKIDLLARALTNANLPSYFPETGPRPETL